MKSRLQLEQEIETLRLRLSEAEETFRAIRVGDVDAMVIGGEVYSLEGAETPYRLLIEAMNEGAASVTEDGTFLYANNQLADLARVPLQELLVSSLSELVEPAEQTALRNLLNEGRHGRGTAEFNLVCRDSTPIPVQFSVRALADKPATTLSVVVTDLRTRKRVENELFQINRAFRTISRGNQSLVRAKTESDLLKAICRAAVDEGGFKMVWIGYAESDACKTVRVMAHAGLDSDYFANTEITWADDERGRGPTGRCIRTREPAACLDIPNDPTFAPWRENALKLGYASSLALPLLEGDTVLGAINFYAREAQFFDVAEITVLQELAEDLAFGIVTLRTREARTRAEEQLRASERRFKSVFEQAAVGMIIAGGPDGQFVNVNRRFCQMLGYTGTELSNRNSNELTHPDDLAGDKAAIEQIRVGAIREFVREKRFRRKDGTIFWAKAFVAPLDPAETDPTLRIGVIEDIDDRKKAEASLRESEERFRRLFEGARDGIFSVASDGTIVALNPAFEIITGWPPNQWLGSPFVDVIYPDDRKQSAELFEKALRGENTPTVELRVLTASGGFRIIEFTGFATHFTHGRAEVQGIGRDITDRKNYESRLRQKSEIINNVYEGVMIVTDEQVISLWNRGAERIFELTASEVVGRKLEAVLGSIQGTAAKSFEDALERVGYWQGEFKSRTRDGRYIVVECRVTKLHDDAGDRAARLYFLSDVTEKKVLEEKYLHAQRLESLGMLAAGIAHDLNNALAPIMFAATMLRERVSQPGDLKLVDTLARSAERGVGLVKQIVGFSRTTTGECVPMQVKHVAHEIAAVIEETFPKSIQFEHDIPTDLWPINGNATQIHQVLLNLCVNARDAMPQGGKLRMILENRRLDAASAEEIPGAQAGAWVFVEISDTGTGIAPELLESIWTPFFTTKPAGRGTGLGLSTVRAIVNNHHGFVALHTEIGAGSAFKLYFPAINAEPATPPNRSAEEVVRGEGQSILVVDDNISIREIVTAILTRRGYRVASCVDGADAIEYFTQHRDDIQLLVTDVDMPRMGGVVLTRLVLKLRPETRIIAMSGLSHDEAGGTGIAEIKTIAHAFLHKPFEASQLLEVVHRLLQTSAKV